MKYALKCLIIISIVITNCSVPFRGNCQGIKFESGLSWQQILAKAKNENKYVFVDCYATWCGPCKYMSKNVFPRDSIGAFFNKHFVNFAIQMDRTKIDPEIIRDRYADADSLANKYSVSSYPTYLIFSPEGKIVHRITGIPGKDGSELISQVSESFDPNKQYYNLIREVTNNKDDSVFLRAALEKAIQSYDDLNIKLIGDLYIRSLKDPFNSTNLMTIERITKSTNDIGFNLLLNSLAKGNSSSSDYVKQLSQKLAIIVCEERMDSILAMQKFPINYEAELNGLTRNYSQIQDQIRRYFESIFKTKVIIAVIFPIIYKDTQLFMDWATVSDKMTNEFTGYDFSQTVLENKARYYGKLSQWKLGCDAVYQLLNQFGNELPPKQINNLVWDFIFQHSGDKKMINEAVKWSRISLEKEPESFANVDTYANLLYKAGNVDEAIKFEKKAIDMFENGSGGGQLRLEADLNEYKSSLNKMIAGKATWTVDQ